MEQNHNTISQWRHRLWQSLQTDDVARFRALLPDAHTVQNASRDIWKLREPPRKKPLLDVVASIRGYINDGQPAIRCLEWLLLTYHPSVYTTKDIQWLIRRNENKMQNEETPDTTRHGLRVINTALEELLITSGDGGGREVDGFDVGRGVSNMNDRLAETTVPEQQDAI
jgi:hypothetical protein